MMSYTQAPLPFIGQKRRFLKAFKTILKQNISEDGAGWTVLDAFGGSGLLSHTAKQTLPQAAIIYNDFDGYSERLRHIGDTNRLRRQIAQALAGLPKNRRLPADVHQEIMQIIRQFDGYKDVQCLASWLLFSGRQIADLDEFYSQKSLYCNIRGTDYPTADGYLDGVQIVHENAYDLIPKYADNTKVLLVLDPPYVCTAQGVYKQTEYFGMVQFLKLMGTVRPPFVFFSSTRSEFLHYLEWVTQTEQPGFERFAGYQTINLRTNINYSAHYDDNLVFKF